MTASSGEPKRRLHPVAALSSTGRALGRLLPLAVLAVVSGRGFDSPLFYWLMILAVPFSLVQGVGGWWRFRYWIQGDELRVERGLVVQKNVFVPRQRVVAVDVTAGVLERIFGLVRLEVKTAARGTQVELSAITRDESERLQRLLSPEQPAVETGSAQAAPRFVLRPTQLLLAASTSGKLGVLLSGVAWLYTQVDELVDPWLRQRLTPESLSHSPSLSPGVIAALVVAGLLVAWVASVVVEVVRFGGFSVERRGNDLVIRRGLLERREIAIAAPRVQAIRIVEGLLRQPLGYGAVVVDSAGHAEEKGQSTLLHPFLHRSDWQAFLQALTPEHAVTPTLTRPPHRALVRFVARPLVASLALAGISSLAFSGGAVLFLLTPLAAWLGWLAYRDTGAGVEGDRLVLVSRGLLRTTQIVARRRIQHASVATSYFQKRRSVSSFGVGVASGAGGTFFVAHNLDATFCRQLLDWAAPVPERDPVAAVAPARAPAS